MQIGARSDRWRVRPQKTDARASSEQERPGELEGVHERHRP